MFALGSCEGFQDSAFHMWCCTSWQCNIQYTEQALKDLGYPIDGNLEFLTCNDLEQNSTHGLDEGSSVDSPSPSNSSSGRFSVNYNIVVPLLTAACGGALVLLVVLVARRAQQRRQALHQAAAPGLVRPAP